MCLKQNEVVVFNSFLDLLIQLGLFNESNNMQYILYIYFSVLFQKYLQFD